MKKIYFLVPVALWGLVYFTVPYAVHESPTGIWWYLTSILLGGLAVVSVFFAINKNL
jgi:hypothetical protein